MYDYANRCVEERRYGVGSFCVLGPECCHKGSGSTTLTNHCIHLFLIPLGLTVEEIEDIGRFLDGPMLRDATDIAKWLVRRAPTFTPCSFTVSHHAVSPLPTTAQRARSTATSPLKTLTPCCRLGKRDREEAAALTRRRAAVPSGRSP